MTTAWTAAALSAIDRADELRIAVRRADGTLRTALPIWAVVADGTVFVRTWHRRDTGWYGRALASGRAHITVPGAEADVAVIDVGDRTELRDAVDAAYRAKHGAGTDRMTGAEAAATTLRLDPED